MLSNSATQRCTALSQASALLTYQWRILTKIWAHRMLSWTIPRMRGSKRPGNSKRPGRPSPISSTKKGLWTMKHVTLGTQQLEVSRLGLGCMGMSAFYTGSGQDDAGAIKTIHRALDLGVTFFDTAEMYGPYANEELLGRALAGHREEVVIATKFGTILHRTDDSGGLDGSAENVRLSVEGSLKRLNTDYIDLYYQHRMDPGTPVEETMGALSELVQEGKIRHIGLSESAPETIRRANAVHPVSLIHISEPTRLGMISYAVF